MFNPKVSIIIPVYNGSNYLAEAIDSALAQTYKNIEVLVINDGSKDDGATEKVALSYGDKIRYFSKENGGVSTALNLGIEKSEGEYISWLSHDDLYYPNKVQKNIENINKQANKDTVITSNFEVIDQNKNHLYYTYDTYHSDNLLYKLILHSFLNGCTLLISKRIFLDVGYFNPSLKTTQDYEMRFRALKRYPFYHISEPLIKSRVHPDQDTNKKLSLVIKERIKLERFVFHSFSIKEISKSAKTKLPILFFSLFLKCRLLYSTMLLKITYLLKKIGLYQYLKRLGKR